MKVGVVVHEGILKLQLVADIDIPEDVNYFIEKIEKKWSSNPDKKPLDGPPFAPKFDGHRVGWAYIRKLEHPLKDKDICSDAYTLCARCEYSYQNKSLVHGTPFSFKGPEFNYLLINVQGQRNFFPEGEKLENLVREDWLLRSEVINVGLEWFDKKLNDNFNKSHIKNPDEVIYDLEQLTYADSVEGRGGTAICCDKAEKIGRKPKLIQTRKIGYEDVISFLSSYGCKIKATSFDEISKMSYVEGADFLVDQILPNIEKFVKQ